MARNLSQRTILPPAGHPAEDQARVSLEADVRSKAQPFHDPRAVVFDQHICRVDELEDQFDPHRRLQIDGDRASSTGDHVGTAGAERVQ